MNWSSYDAENMSSMMIQRLNPVSSDIDKAQNSHETFNCVAVLIETAPLSAKQV